MSGALRTLRAGSGVRHLSPKKTLVYHYSSQTAAGLVKRAGYFVRKSIGSQAVKNISDIKYVENIESKETKTEALDL